MRSQLRRLAAAAFALVPVLSMAQPRSRPVPVPPEGLLPEASKLFSEYILLETPTATLDVGNSYALGSIPTEGCYVTSGANEGGSYQRISYEWSSVKERQKAAWIAQMVGFSSTFVESTSGSFVLDSVFERKAKSMNPNMGPECTERGSDQLPQRPGVASLIGTRRITFRLLDGNTRSLNARATTAVAGSMGGSTFRADTSGTTTTIFFDKAVWLGAQFMAYTMGPVKDTVVTNSARLDDRITVTVARQEYIVKASRVTSAPVPVQRGTPAAGAAAKTTTEGNGDFRLTVNMDSLRTRDSQDPLEVRVIDARLPFGRLKLGLVDVHAIRFCTARVDLHIPVTDWQVTKGTPPVGAGRP